MEIKNYTISGLNSLKELPWLKVAQFTLNSRQFPSKRNTVKLLSELKSSHNAKIIVHYDMIYIISRFALFTDSVQNAILNEIIDIIDYSKKDSSIQGIIMHTDFPFAKDVIGDGGVLIPDKVKSHYNGSLWKIQDSIFNMDVFGIVRLSINEFYRKFFILHPEKPNIKIYLENTTKAPKQTIRFNELIGSYGYLRTLLYEDSYLQDLFGLCYDTEHEFAVTGASLRTDLWSDISHIVHLNTIPSIVLPESYKDKHSNTTITECSVHSWSAYSDYIEFLNNKGIPWVREVKEDTMFREQEQLKSLSYE